MKVLIVGAGLGGLACAIACKKEGLEVVVLERANRIVPIGSGIQVPPNGTRIARQLGFLDRLLERGVAIDGVQLRRYANGEPLHPLSEKSYQEQYGDPWMVVHRADFHAVMWDECEALGVDLCLDLDVESIDFENNTVWLEDGDDISGDVVIGSDGMSVLNLIGLYSVCRNQLLGKPSPAAETGDVAYRASFPLEYLKSLNDAKIEELYSRKRITIWVGPQKYTLFYPVRGGKEFNLVLFKPDVMPHGQRHIDGEVGEMRQEYEGWDETLVKLISRIPRVQKWKPCTHPELETWTKKCVALLGDSCHPSLPYQAQGAAMAIEDGAVLGRLLGMLNTSAQESLTELIPEVLQLYESLRKSRTTLNVQGARSNHKWYRVPDGPEQQARDAEMAGSSLGEGLLPTGWSWIDSDYQQKLLGHDSVAEAVEAFKAWETSRA
ncbi:salicylate hydroxylase [Colletotrichum truncatum]|uniref:Salicylate hydroxylase n=1 Tax=Colletotrichum truncatum TaxID=5467 RepID=A0ACC3ZFG8_COLTU|nr:salicylate hydroxylase [Colletotrichum truncatum]KAF6801776.1 salicylate hydroxylase [Colletotrichum truncatum]